MKALEKPIRMEDINSILDKVRAEKYYRGSTNNLHFFRIATTCIYKLLALSVNSISLQLFKINRCMVAITIVIEKLVSSFNLLS